MTYDPQGLALQIFQSRHAAHPNETWLEGGERVAQHVANAETGAARTKWRTEFQQVLQDNTFMPGGRIWYGSGRVRGQLLNCFVIDTSDSREGWAKTVGDSIIISGTGGGVGANFSPTRPRGSVIGGTGGIATGAVSEMEMVNSVGNVIKAGGGRRTALMFGLSLSHGDIVEFMDKKLDRNELNNANVSVIFDEDPEAFFKLVREDANWELKHNGRVVGTISARALWQRMVENAVKPRDGQGGGEPGLLNSYLANRMSNIWYLEKLTCTNPCQPGWATVLTPEGIRTMSAIDVGSTIWSGKRWTKVIRKVATGIKKVKAYRTRAGTFYGTGNHRVVQNGEKIEAQHATAIDLNVGPFAKTAQHDPLHVVDGLVLGDGSYHAASNRVFLCAGPDEIGQYRRDLGNVIGAYRPGVTEHSYETLASFDTLALTYDREIPSDYLRACPAKLTAFLRGLYSANGSIVAGRVTLKAASFKVIEGVQQMLSSVGIMSYYTVNKEHDVEHHNGVYTSRESYDLNIGTLLGRQRFHALIGFIQTHKTVKLLASLDSAASTRTPKTTYEIVLTDDISEEEVYDITVDAEEHTYWTGGMLVSNCGEIWLSPYDCCCLGHIVLPRFVRNGKTQWEAIRNVVTIGVRFLDDVLTINQYPLQQIAEKCSQLRRIGLGVTGLHHMLLELGLGYNTPEGLEFVDKLMSFVKNASYEASSDLALEKGSFPAFDAEKFLQGKFIKMLKPSIRQKIAKQGQRNCALNTIAPVGTGSMVTDTSSGVEPIFAVGYKRKFRKGDELAEEIVLDPLFKKAVAEGHDTSHFVGAHELSMRDHFEIQRVVQRHIDNAVSKTINLPKGVSPEELSALYMEFLPDLKGVTVYPDGSREDQPLTPLSRDEALRLAQESLGLTTAVSSADGCRGGSCDL